VKARNATQRSAIATTLTQDNESTQSRLSRFILRPEHVRTALSLIPIMPQRGQNTVVAAHRDEVNRGRREPRPRRVLARRGPELTVAMKPYLPVVRTFVLLGNKHNGFAKKWTGGGCGLIPLSVQVDQQAAAVQHLGTLAIDDST
jgi:hypothetical protein